MKIARVKSLLMGALLALALPWATSSAELAPEEGFTETLPIETPPHWVWILDGGASQIDSRLVLVDGDSGAMKGMLSSGYWTPGAATSGGDGSPSRLIVNETYFSRGSRGTREDIVAIYDASTFLPIKEIPVPPRRMTALTMQHMTGLTGDQKTFAITNFTPAQSISLVDVEAGKLIEEVDTPGCGQIYPAGDNRIMALCGDGTMLTLTISTDETGVTTVDRTESEAFFDPHEDPIIVPSARLGDTWYFVSFDGKVLELDASTDKPVLRETWSLVSEKEKRKEWRTGGLQSLTLHEESGLLFVLMHQGGEETYEEPSKEVWVYDTKTRERLRRMKLKNVSLEIAVSQDSEPLIFAAAFQTVVPTWMLFVLGVTGGLGDINNYIMPVLDVYDARTGKHLRTVENVAHFPARLMVP